MAFFPFSSGPDWSFEIEYTASNGRATALYCNNNSGGTIFGEVTLQNGQKFSQTFGPGETRLNLPNNVVTIQSVTNDGETYLWPVPVVSQQVRIVYG